MITFTEFHREHKVTKEQNSKGEEYWAMRLNRVGSMSHGSMLTSALTQEAMDWAMRHSYESYKNRS